MQRTITTFGRALAIAFAALVASGPRPALAQVNTERYNAGQEDQEGLTWGVRADASISRGNINLTSYSGAASLRRQHLYGPEDEWSDAPDPGVDKAPPLLKDRQLLIVNARQASIGDNTFTNRAFAHGRWTRMWLPRIGSEVFAQVQFDEFLALNIRLLAGVGARFLLLNTPLLSIDAGTGYMPEYEIFDQETIGSGSGYANPRLNHRWTNYLNVMLTLFKGELLAQGTSYVQPRFGDFGDIHTLHSLVLATPLGPHLRLNLTFEYQQDTAPPPNIEAVDVRFTPGLTAQF